ncbi:MAG: cytochrome c3 family protein [Thermodesulfobacteriota bacterium]
MGRVNISQLIRYIILLLLFALVPCTKATPTENSASPNDCLKCHNEIWQEEIAKRYIHPPFREKKCTGCHATNNRVRLKDPVISSSGDDSENWTGKNLIPATSHWFEFKSAENPATMILEASYGSMVRLYREIPLPPLDNLTDVTDVYGQNPPKIYNVTVPEVKKGIFLSASISWQTDRPTGSMITYGVGKLQQNTPLNNRLQTEHLETLSSLEADQTYRFRITAEDAIGNRTDSDIFKFSTTTTFSKLAKKPVPKDCCLVAPLGLKSKFFRKGDRYLVNITVIRPVKLLFALLGQKCPITEAPNEPETLDEQPQTTKHIITNKEETTTFIICKTCHRDFICRHPVNVYPKRGMKVPSDYPTMADGRVSCISCHAPHASDHQYRMIKDHRQELCIGCHSSFN